MDELHSTSPADAPESSLTRSGPAHLAVGEGPEGDGEAEPPRPRRRRWIAVAVLMPLVLFLLAVVAWAVDTASGGVPRNVKVAGVEVSGLTESALRARLEDLADDFGSTPVVVVADGHSYEAVAEGLGLHVDVDRTARRALEVDADTFVLARPVAWMRSFFDERDPGVSYRVSGGQAERGAVEMEGEDRTLPTEPQLELVDGAFAVVPGVDGEGIDPASLADALPSAASSVPLGEPIRVEVERSPIPPLVSDEVARDAASRAEALVAGPLEVRTAAGARTLEPEVMRTWVRLSSQPDGRAELVLDPTVVTEDLAATFRDIEGAPVDARITLQDGVPVVVPDQPGLVCCSDAAPERVLAALTAGEDGVELDLVEGQAAFTTADAEAYQIAGPVGGSHAWQNGAPTTAGPGFTTYHAPTGARIINIHRIADLVRGVVIPPGGSFSVNDHVGRRTAENGFVAAGAISNGQHVDEIGGGISQFATTLFNAAYFAGLDIPTYQAHSEYFDRYPYGREATMGFPAPDLVITNSTPYGVLVWTSYTQSSLTVTLYSSPYATAEQTGLRESMEGRCRVVVTTRTRTYPDGSTEEDTFRARYRPGEGQSC
ncbi:MAG: VanW family protein [Acidimicrobiia bacterium]